MRYDIDALISTFASHADDFDASQLENLKKFPEMTEENGWGFNVSRAFLEICKELKQCKAALHDYN